MVPNHLRIFSTCFLRATQLSSIQLSFIELQKILEVFCGVRLNTWQQTYSFHPTKACIVFLPLIGMAMSWLIGKLTINVMKASEMCILSLAKVTSGIYIIYVRN